MYNPELTQFSYWRTNLVAFKKVNPAKAGDAMPSARACLWNTRMRSRMGLSDCQQIKHREICCS